MLNFQTLLDASLPYLSHYGLVIVFAGALVEGETITLLAGVLSHRGAFPFGWTVMTVALGAFTGDQIWFYLGRCYGQDVLSRFQRVARQVDRVRPWLEHNSDWIAVGSRFVYGTRIAAPMVLGMHGYPPARFAVINSISAGLWALTVVGAGYLVGAGAEQLFGRIKHTEQLILVVILLMLVRWWYRRRKLLYAAGKSS